ncbi:uncharacterized protein LOC113235507 isoform X2 [Hyposmocoma kahamanoa]|uniref:uncharacterized protein LOC113235507 isoform X2 n=1 Tax=Hyposmocoma kahamanoa TaxID=1477025 RepID=UPI000E6D6C1B|nr:uncharacterized protein LOC113235507 isoform X2 [Hyposmocoma kahamanoa]
MPASSIDLYHMQDARNNFDAMRPAPICAEANQYMGQCQNIHVSTNCYYGYHDPKTLENSHVTTDCEMLEMPQADGMASASPKSNARKRSADDSEYPLSKRIREEGTVPATTNHNPCFLRPTHNNPDISRCLMVHMI